MTEVTDRQRILLVGNYPPPFGGISIHVRQLERLINRWAGRSAMVLDVEPSPAYAKSGVISPDNRVDFFRQLFRALKHATCVHLHTNGQNYKSWTIIAAVVTLARLTKTRAVLTIHSGDSKEYMASLGRLRRAVFPGSLKRYDRVVAVNNVLAEYLGSLPGLQGKVVTAPAYLGLECAPADLEGSKPGDFIKSHSPVFSTIISFRPEYGLETALRALRELVADYPDAGLIVVGSGPGEHGVREEIDQFGLTDSVCVVRDIGSDTIYAILKESDAYIRATHYDGDSISVREALSLGVPVAATKTDFRPGGVRTFPVGDASALSNVLTSILNGAESGAGIEDPGDRSDSSQTLLALYDELHRGQAVSPDTGAFSRLRGSLLEIRFRVRQECWNRIHGVKVKRCVEPLSVAPSFTHAFFANSTEMAGILRALQPYPEYREAVVRRADRLAAGEFDLLGYRSLRFGDGRMPSWHHDPVNDVETPRSWWRHALKRGCGAGADPKIIWELNRHQFLTTLGVAYQLTRDETYRELGCTLISSWIEENPPYAGINWASGLELAFRSISWLWAWQLLELGDRKEMHAPMVRCLAAHGEFIAHNLSIYHSPNTHITGEALGLLHLGLAFIDSPRGKMWAKQGLDLMLEYLPVHVLEDGGYVERSLWYHRYTLEFYQMLLLLGRRFDLDLGGEVAEGVRRMANFMMYAAGPDGTFPLMGDDDGGSLLHFGGAPSGADVSGLFSLLALEFGNANYAHVARRFNPGTLWLAGSCAGEEYGRIRPQPPCETFFRGEASGYCFFRSDWSHEAIHLAFYNGPFGWLNCGHAHAHQLSFVLRKGRKSMVIDPGTYTYHGAERNEYRGPGMHATVFVGGRHPAEPAAASFQWDRIPGHCSAQPAERSQVMAGALVYPGGTKLVRTVHVAEDGLCIVEDVLHGMGRETITLKFPLSGSGWRVDEDMVVDRRLGFSLTWLADIPITVALSSFQASESYGSRTAGTMCRVDMESELPARVITLLDLSGKERRVEWVPDELGGRTSAAKGGEPLLI